MAGIRKFFRILKVLYYAILGGGIAFIFWGVFVSLILGICGVLEETSDIYMYAWYTYVVIVLLIIIRNAIHRMKWYVCAHPTRIQCHQCRKTVPVRRYGDERCLNAPFGIYVSRKIIQFIHPISDKIPFFEIFYRPYLQLDCPECGEKQVICPYCHEPIPQESVITLYDKPSKCPHCGKKIYTPVPLQEWEKELIKVKNLSD